MRLTPISKTETLLDAIKTLLDALKINETDNRFSQIAKFPGTSASALLEFLPALSLPCAAIIYSGSNIANRPLRTLRVSVAVLCEAYEADDIVTLRDHIDAVMHALDDQISGDALIVVESDAALDLPDNPATAAALINIRIEDH